MLPQPVLECLVTGPHIRTVPSSLDEAIIVGSLGFQLTQFTVLVCPLSTATGFSRFECQMYTLLSSLPLARKSWFAPPKHEYIVNFACLTPWYFRTRTRSLISQRWRPWKNQPQNKRLVIHVYPTLTNTIHKPKPPMTIVNNSIASEQAPAGRVWPWLEGPTRNPVLD